MREARLQEEAAHARIADGVSTMHARRKLEAFQREKAEQEAALAKGVAEAKAKAAKEASALNVKIEKMRKLQELALGSGGGDQGTSGDGGAPVRKPSPRGRQLLYWEALKSKTKETSSMSWRGQDVFAHEQGI